MGRVQSHVSDREAIFHLQAPPLHSANEVTFIMCVDKSQNRSLTSTLTLFFVLSSRFPKAHHSSVHTLSSVLDLAPRWPFSQVAHKFINKQTNK